MSSRVLDIQGLRTGYGRVEVLRGVDLHVDEGELVTVIGANGAGKSTLLKSVVGIVQAWSGATRFMGADVTGIVPEKAVRSGIALVPEGRMLFGSLSVEANLELGAYSRRGGESTAAMQRVFELFPVLGERRAQSAATLSGGEQQMLAVGRALMSEPRLLLLDEPSLGLAPKVIAEIFAALESLRAAGMTILLVEQDARLALRHADRGYVMRTGQVALEGSSADLLANDDVRLIYLGGWHDADGSTDAEQGG